MLKYWGREAPTGEQHANMCLSGLNVLMSKLYFKSWGIWVSAFVDNYVRISFSWNLWPLTLDNDIMSQITFRSNNQQACIDDLITLHADKIGTCWSLFMHYSDIIMGAIASQITSLAIV